MNNLTKEEFTKIYKDDKNLTDKPIFIDFYADWWGPCKNFKRVLEKVIPDYDDKINMYKVNVSNEMELANMFRVSGIPYMVFISKSGEMDS